MSVALHGAQTAELETSPFSDSGRFLAELPKAHFRSNLPIDKDGPALAISNILLGGAVLLARSKRHGGARNRADRESEALTGAQVGKLLAATAHSLAIGLPFTRMITIHWQSAGVPLAKMVVATGRFVDLLCKAIARFGSRTAWLWVHESGPRKDCHCHLFAYVPAGFVKRLQRMQMRWLRAITGNTYRKQIIKSKPIGGLLGLESGNPALHEVNLWAAVGYVLKGAEPSAVAHFRLALVKPGGRVIGRRCSTSQNIGRTAREANA